MSLKTWVKGLFPPNWRSISGGWSGGTYDVFGSKREPTPQELIKAFEETVYGCTTLIARQVSAVNLRLMTESNNQQNHTLTQKDVTFWKKEIAPARRVSNIDEITSHPLLDLIYRVNPHMTLPDLLALTQLSLDVVGDAFWRLRPNDYGYPHEIYFLPAHNVEITYDEDGCIVAYKNMIGVYDYETIPAEQVIHFRTLNLLNPYGRGYSPLRAVWQEVQLKRKEMSSLESVVTNLARPDGILSPSSQDGSLGDKETKRLSKDFMSRFLGPNQGGVFVSNQPVNYQPINFQTKSYAELQIFDNMRKQVFFAYQVPTTFLDQAESSFASSEAAEYNLATRCIKPRVKSLVETLNSRLVPLFGEDLFFVFDDVVPQDKTYELQKVSMGVSIGALSVNDWRVANGYPPVPQGNELRVDPQPSPPSMSMSLPTRKALPKPVAKQIAFKTLEEKAPSEKALADLLREFFTLQKTSLLNSVHEIDLQNVAIRSVLSPEDHALPWYCWKATPSATDWFDLSEWTDEMAKELQPVIELFSNFATAETLTRIGGSPEIESVVQPGVQKAVQELTLKLCQETNKTTSLLLSDAMAKLREELGEGIGSGESRQEITKRVESVFDQADVVRADRIAVTERSRAIHTASLVTAKESGLVKGKKWLAVGNSCPICLGYEKQGTVPLDKDFANVDGPYGDVSGPPGHANCRCTLNYELGEI